MNGATRVRSLVAAAGLAIVVTGVIQRLRALQDQYLNFSHSIRWPSRAGASEETGPGAVPAKVQPGYVTIDPPIMASVGDVPAVRYVEVTVELQTAAGRDAKLVRTHWPRLKSIVMQTLQEQPYS